MGEVDIVDEGDDMDSTGQWAATTQVTSRIKLNRILCNIFQRLCYQELDRGPVSDPVLSTTVSTAPGDLGPCFSFSASRTLIHFQKNDGS